MKTRIITLIISFGLSANVLAAVGDIGVYTSPAKTFGTASYWIEGSDSVLLIDTQFLPKEGILAVDAAEKATGKKVSTAIVLHPNPDKFNGTALLQAKGIKVLTSAQVAQLIPAVHDIRWGWFGAEFAPDYPKDAAQPSIFGSTTVQLTFAGLPVTLHVLGKGASAAHVVAQYRDHVFVGDLINPQNHAWLELGLIGPWLQRLEDIRGMKPGRIYPGRGKVGGVELIEQQASYLRKVQTWVREHLPARAEGPAGRMSWWTKSRLQSQIESAYPGLGYPLFMRDGLEAVWQTEAASR
jgi:glyoxylase-like metal-dependent hydrolase (beta-lactamase superfamily II)